MEITATGLLWTYIALVVITLIVRIRVHLIGRSLSLVNLLQYVMMSILPGFNVLFTSMAVYDEFSDSLEDIIIIGKKGRSGSMLSFLDRYKTEIVTIDKYYAVRQTRSRLGVFKQFWFLNLRYRESTWFQKNNRDFQDCLTDDIDHVTREFVKHGNNAGVPICGGSITMADIVPMLKMAETDVGLRDLLSSAKAWYVLKDNGQA